MRAAIVQQEDGGGAPLRRGRSPEDPRQLSGRNTTTTRPSSDEVSSRAERRPSLPSHDYGTEAELAQQRFLGA